MDDTTIEVLVDCTDYVVYPKRGLVQEWGTDLWYEPATKHGFQHGRNGQRISLTSYDSFGVDCHRREYAQAWCDRAQRAWDKVMGGGDGQ